MGKNRRKARKNDGFPGGNREKLRMFIDYHRYIRNKTRCYAPKVSSRSFLPEVSSLSFLEVFAGGLK